MFPFLQYVISLITGYRAFGGKGGNMYYIYICYDTASSFLKGTGPLLQLMDSGSENWLKSRNWARDRHFPLWQLIISLLLPCFGTFWFISLHSRRLPIYLISGNTGLLAITTHTYGSEPLVTVPVLLPITPTLPLMF